MLNMSIKKIIISIISMMLILLFIMLGFNSFTMQTITENFSKLHKNINYFLEDFTDLDFNIRVLDNIIIQKPHVDNLPSDRKLHLEAVYAENYSEAKENLAELNETLTVFKSILDNLPNLPTTSYQTQKTNLFAAYLEASDHFNRINQSFDRYYKETLYDSQPFKSSIQEDYTALGAQVTHLNRSFENANSKLIYYYTRLISGIIYFFILVIICLTYMLIRLIRKEMKYVTEGLEKLSAHDYDCTSLSMGKVFFKEEHEVHDLVENIFREQRFIKRTKDIVLRGYIMDEILEELFLHLQGTFELDRIGIAFVDYKEERFIAEYGISNQSKVLLGPGFFVNFDETTLTNTLESKQPSITADLEAELKQRPNSASLKLLLMEGIQSNMILPLLKDDSVFAILFFSSTEKNKFNQSDLDLASKVVYDLGAVLDISYLTKVIFSEITSTFAELVDKKDNETGGHIVRMVNYSKIIAMGLLNHPNPAYQVDKKFVSEIERNASVHDIGKVGIPDAILKKPGKLTSEEFDVMKTHPEIGGEIFANLRESLRGFNENYYKIAEEITLYHHERWDGSGYPKGLRGNDIPLSARIVAIADVFDALTSERVYKKAFSFEDAIKLIEDSAGTHFDPVIVEVFLNELDGIKRIYNRYRD